MWWRVTAYYNENDEFAAEWLRNLIAAGLIADGEVDTRSIVDVRPGDLRGFDQCHFFAGIGGWSYGLRRAGWADSSPVWTGSCPCQPFSLAGTQKGFADERHLWPIWRELIRECGPAIIFGEQVASATDWLGLVRSDLEAMGRAVGAIPIQAASAGADHLRDRYWFVAYADSLFGQVHPDARGGADRGGARALAGLGCSCDGDMGYTVSARTGRDSGNGSCTEAASSGEGHSNGRCGDPSQPPNPTFDWVIGADGKARRVKPGLRLLAHGVPARVGKLRGFGNAIDPRPAAAFIEAFMTSVSLHQRGGE